MAIEEREEFYQAGGAMDFRRPSFFQAKVNILNRFEINPEVMGDGSQHFLEVEGTLPANPAISAVYAVEFDITSAGESSLGSQQAFFVDFLPGYTGNVETFAAHARNGVAGTGGNNTNGNVGLGGESFAITTGKNIGVQGYAIRGDINQGGYFQAYLTKDNATNIGVVGAARNPGSNGIQVGAYFRLTDLFVPLPGESAALIADNDVHASPIILARDNGTSVWSVQDGGSVQGKMATKTLTESVATAFVRVAVPQGTCVGGCVHYTIEANNGVDFQARSGILPFAAVNKAGAETVSVGTPDAASEVVAVSAGTLTNTFTATAGTDTVDILADATSSLAQTTLRISYRVEMYSNAVVAVTPL